MKILIDTNIVLDIMLAREPFLEPAKELIRMIDRDRIQAYITANSITDIVYISRKVRTLREIQQLILDLLDMIDVIGVDREDIVAAFDFGFNDFEDALQSRCAIKEDIDYIVTRNKKDFSKSKVTAVDIAAFLAEHNK